MTHSTTILSAYRKRLKTSKVRDKDEAYALLLEVFENLRVPEPSVIPADPKAMAILHRVAKASYVPLEQIREGNKGEALPARQLAMWLLQHEYGPNELGRYFDRNHCTVIHSCKTVEERLDTGDAVMTEIYNRYKELENQ